MADIFDTLRGVREQDPGEDIPGLTDLEIETNRDDQARIAARQRGWIEDPNGNYRDPETYKGPAMPSDKLRGTEEELRELSRDPSRRDHQPYPSPNRSREPGSLRESLMPRHVRPRIMSPGEEEQRDMQVEHEERLDGPPGGRPIPFNTEDIMLPRGYTVTDDKYRRPPGVITEEDYEENVLRAQSSDDYDSDSVLTPGTYRSDILRPFTNEEGRMTETPGFRSTVEGLEERGMPGEGGAPSPARQEMQRRAEERRRGRRSPAARDQYEAVTEERPEFRDHALLTPGEAHEYGKEQESRFADINARDPIAEHADRMEAMKDPKYRADMRLRWDKTNSAIAEIKREGGQVPSSMRDDLAHYEKHLEAHPDTQAFKESGGTQGVLNRQHTQSMYNQARDRGGVGRVYALEAKSPAFAAQRDKVMKVDLETREGEAPRRATKLSPFSDVAVAPMEGRTGGIHVKTGKRYKPPGLATGKYAPTKDYAHGAPTAKDVGRRYKRAVETRGFRQAKRDEPFNAEQNAFEGGQFKIMSESDVQRQYGQKVNDIQLAAINNKRRKAHKKGVIRRDKVRAQMKPDDREFMLQKRRNSTGAAGGGGVLFEPPATPTPSPTGGAAGLPD